MTFTQLARNVREQLGQDHRYAHVVRVARLAGRLAARHGESARRARLAGMLHDLARLYPPDRLLDECAHRGLAIDAFERANPVVLHARLGAELARERYGIDDETILSAIRKHTLAAENMSRLDKVVFLADGLEPGRNFPERPGFEALAFEDLDAGMLVVLRSSVKYVRDRGGEPAPQTFAAIAALEAPSPREEPRLPDLIDLVQEAALDKKAEDVLVLPLEGRTIVADAFVIATGRSKIQTRSIADGIAESAKAAGRPVARMEGYSDGGWILLDLGAVVVHVFTPELRTFYNLERLWGAGETRRAQSS